MEYKIGTAAYAWNKAYLNMIKSTNDLVCSQCNNIGIVVVTTIDLESATKYIKTTLPCFVCHVNLKSTREFIYWHIYDYVWCECVNRRRIIHAKDGQDVFNADTKICKSCGMVVKFGR